MDCFKKSSVTEIISSINQAGSQLPANTPKKNNQVYIEVYEQDTKQYSKDFQRSIDTNIISVSKPLLTTNGSISDPNNSPKQLVSQDIIIKHENNRIKELLSRIEDYKQIVGRYKKTIQAMHKTNLEIEDEVKKHVEKIVNHNMEISKLKFTTKEAQDKMKEIELSKIELLQRINILNISIEGKDKRIIDLHVNSSKLDELLEDKTNLAKNLQEQIDSTNDIFLKLQTSVNDIKKLYGEKCEECIDLNNKLTHSTFSNQGLKTNFDMLQGKYNEIEKQLENKSNKIIDLNLMIKDLTFNTDKETNMSKKIYDELKIDMDNKLNEKNIEIEELKKMFPE
uniref:Uncharacterized protein n=1 Tax=viral metagenome TaxID=1070528 RepID=A0A6C0LYJ8_9ZZZZ